MKTTFTTAAFERSHGRKPRGFGNWAFQASSTRTAFEHERSGPVLFFTGTLSEAKAQLKAAGQTGHWAVMP